MSLRVAPILCSLPLACLALAWPLRAGTTGGSVPGLAGNTGNDLTLDYLYGLKTFESLPASWDRFYFSDDAGGLLPAGNDSNPCTEAAPCLSAAKMDALLNLQQVVIVLDAGLWDDPADELAGWTGFDFDNSGCGSEAGPGANSMTDEPCAFMVPYDPNQPARFDCAAFSGSVDMKFWLQTRGNGSGYLGVAGALTDRCPEDADAAGTSEWGVHVSRVGCLHGPAGTRTRAALALGRENHRLNCGSRASRPGRVATQAGLRARTYRSLQRVGKGRSSRSTAGATAERSRPGP